MAPVDDATFLSQYVRDHSEDAFRELVNRHLNLVYSAALRQVSGDTHRAQDIAQTVFADLARKASSVARHPTLSGWLYSSTHFAAAKMLRSERRRQNREQKAHTMESLLGESGPSTNWEQLRPVLDDVMHELGARQRTALILRFFEQRPTTEISRILGLSERGVRKNLEGSLERLRIALRKRGIDSTTAALATLLSTETILAAPAGLAATVGTSALAATSSAIGVASTVAAVHLMTTKLTIGILGALAVAATGGILLERNANQRLLETNASLTQELTNRAHAATALQNSNKDLVETLRSKDAEANRANLELSLLRGRLATASPQKAGAIASIINSSQAMPPGQLYPGLTPASSLINAGHATPADAFQTEQWATNTRSFEDFAASITFNPSGRARDEETFATLPEDMRAQYGTAERLAAAIVFDYPSSKLGFAGDQVLGQVAQNGPDNVTLETIWQYNDGRVRKSTWNFIRDNSGNWRREVVGGVIELWLKEQAQKAK